MNIINVEQGSAAWLALRVGRVTASRVADVVAKTKTGWGASRANYAAELIAERLTGVPAEKYANGAMQWGTNTEPEARSVYELVQGVTVRQVGLVIHATIAMSAASPDGLVGDDGLVEIKCPNTATHIQTLLGSEVDGRYEKQMQWQMACTGRSWCDWVSYDPRLPAEMQIIIRRVPRDDAAIKDLETEIKKFLAEIDSTVARLKSLYIKDAGQ